MIARGWAPLTVASSLILDLTVRTSSSRWAERFCSSVCARGCVAGATAVDLAVGKTVVERRGSRPGWPDQSPLTLAGLSWGLREAASVEAPATGASVAASAPLGERKYIRAHTAASTMERPAAIATGF